MIEEPPLLKIKKTRNRPTASQIAAFENVPTSLIVDARGGRGALASNIMPVTKLPLQGHSVAGPALTAENHVGDILASFAAIHHAQPGDILLAGFAGHQGCAAAGDRMIGMLKNAGGRAMITDGPVRDIHGINQLDIPVWATGLTPATPHLTGPGRVGFDLQIGGQSVGCGDMVICDADGVVIVPFDEIDQVISAVQRVRELEQALDEKVEKGLITSDRVLDILQSARTLITDD